MGTNQYWQYNYSGLEWSDPSCACVRGGTYVGVVDVEGGVVVSG